MKENNNVSFNIHNVTELTIYLKNVMDTFYGPLAPANH